MTLPSDIEQQVEETKADMSAAAAATEKTAETGSSSDEQSAKQLSRKSKASHIVVPMDSSVLQMVVNSTLDEPEPEDPDRRKAQLYCGSCCDLLQASAIVDMMYVPWMLLSVLFNLDLYRKTMASLEENDGEDNELVAELTQEASRLFLIIIKNACGVPFGLLGIFGAYKFYKYPVLVTGIWFCVDLVWSCVLRRFIMLALVFNIYPHFALFDALRRGQITRENYKRSEKHCCCRNAK